jgi:hypothetical protein
LKKIVVVHGHRVELHSLDGETWGTDLVQLQERIKQREKEQAKILGEAKKFLRGRPGLAEKTRL